MNQQKDGQDHLYTQIRISSYNEWDPLRSIIIGTPSNAIPVPTEFSLR